MRTIQAHYFYNDTYGQKYYFCPGYSAKSLKAKIKEVTNKDEEICLKNSGGVTFHVNDIIFIWIQFTSRKSLQSLVHECVHAASYTFMHRGVGKTLKNDEHYAYLTEYIFENCITKMRIK